MKQKINHRFSFTKPRCWFWFVGVLGYLCTNDCLDRQVDHRICRLIRVAVNFWGGEGWVTACHHCRIVPDDEDAQSLAKGTQFACVKKVEVIWPNARALPRWSLWMMNHEWVSQSIRYVSIELLGQLKIIIKCITVTIKSNLHNDLLTSSQLFILGILYGHISWSWQHGASSRA